MVKSIQFTGEKATDYINDKNYKYVKVAKKDCNNPSYYECRHSRFSNRGGKAKKVEYYNEVEDGYKNAQLRENLLGKKIEFDSSRINVIFGPNASGKTTILKAIAANALCGQSQYLDGITSCKKYEPLDFGLHSLKDILLEGESNDDNTFTLDNLKKLIQLAAKNDAIVEWDGCPVYYHNFSTRNSTKLGEMAGSALASFKDECLFRLDKDKMSSAQLNLTLFSNIIEICANAPSIEDIAKFDEKCNNERFVKACKLQSEYISSFSDGSKPIVKMTLLLDEIDKSLDIKNSILLYKKVLPYIAKELNVQIIVVSHNLLMLTDIVKGSDDYNFIALDSNYVNELEKELKTITFNV